MRALTDRLLALTHLLDRVDVLNQIGRLDAADAALLEAEALHALTTLPAHALLSRRLRELS
ncbi:MAG: hypothetical protein AAGA48_32815 [Myxococcota bacterium]